MTDDAPLLVIDTSGDRCLVGLDRGAEGCTERGEPMKRGHAERLVPLIGETLHQAGIAASDIGGVVVCIGPGGFTGVRIGVATALGFARGIGKPCHGVDLFSVEAHCTEGRVQVVHRMSAETFAVQEFENGVALGLPKPTNGIPLGSLVIGGAASFAPVVSRLAAVARQHPSKPIPLYLRPPDAAPSRHQPPASLS